MWTSHTSGPFGVPQPSSSSKGEDEEEKGPSQVFLIFVSNVLLSLSGNTSLVEMKVEMNKV